MQPEQIGLVAAAITAVVVLWKVHLESDANDRKRADKIEAERDDAYRMLRTEQGIVLKLIARKHVPPRKKPPLPR